MKLASSALFVAALLANLRLGGTSPIVWIDTFNDEHEVRRCLADDSCTLTGVSTSVPGQAHAVAWLELRTLLAWLGVGIDGAHLTMLVSNALAVVLVFYLGVRLGNVCAGTFAAWLLMDRLDAFARMTALYNTSPLLFLGTVLLLACTAVIVRPNLVSVTLAALVAALMANVHLACAMTGASVVWVALLAPRRRFALAAFGALVFVLGTFAMAPPTWLHNISSLLQDRGARGHLVAVNVAYNPMMNWALLAVGAWIASFALRTDAAAAYRRQVQGALAVLVPSLAVFLIAPRYGFNAEAKYIFHLKAACALAAALPLAAVAQRLLPLRMQQALPFVLAVVLAVSGDYGARARVTAADERTPTVADVAAVAHLLQSEQQWTGEEILRNLKTPEGITFLSGLRYALPPTLHPVGAPGHRERGAIFLTLDPAVLPEPMPPSWRIVRRTRQSVVVLVLMRSRIDWRELLVCIQPADGSPQRCDRRSWQPEHELFVAHLPPGGAGWQGKLRLSLALHPTAAGFVDEIFMPRMPFVCGGRVVSTPAGTISADQRHASITTPAIDQATPAIVTLEWQIGAPECHDLAYDGMVPFFVEGDAGTVSTVAAVLRRQERAP